MPVITDKFGRASIPTDVAIATTVKTTRTAGVAVLEAIDLSKYATDTPVFFVTYKKTTDPVTGIVSVTNLVSYKALVNAGANTLTNLTVAPGYVDLGNAVGDFIECIPTSYWENSLIDGLFIGLNPDGTFKKSALKSALGDDGNLTQVMDEVFSDFILTGGVWSLVSGLNGAMTALTGYIDGYRNTVAAIATRAYTVSKDTYVDILRNTSTNVFTVVYTEVANGAAAPALAANSIRIAIVTTDGTTITKVRQRGYDSLGNRIRNDAATPTVQSNDWWEELGRDTVTTGTKTLLTVPIQPRKYMRVVVVQHSGGTSLGAGVRFNGDSATNYAYRTTENGGADSAATNQTWLQMGNNTLEGMNAEFQIINEAVYRKVMHGVETFWDTAGNLYRNVYAGYWQNNTVQIKQIDLLCTSGSFAVGSEIIVLGHD